MILYDYYLFNDSVLEPMNETAADLISGWGYSYPYDVYDFKGKKNGYLFNNAIWGIEQFCLIYKNEVIGQVACQYDNGNLWVGWALSPELCGKGNGTLFITRCIDELRRVKQFYGPLYLKVAAWNKRAIKAYQKAGFIYIETVVDEIAYTNNFEDFWVMKHY